ncbi:glycosyltransferase family 4 protein [Lactiplantibacillus plantarum]|uniref:glycosyltransferase family 4 protein n=1 Tax=Lactiplantibacillus plantarum TaxID=1590 RepID=UPI00298BFC19|nr:glycosyltransferase family 4 protein [Lactiplantibacillus plantarum]WPB53071.1 glycosyltransferase family 4 protein [Lactiplantibacillus plantarum]WPG34224.1 glycosyltransferase family 4 protein [Lactiplantibacillus plantarum]
MEKILFLHAGAELYGADRILINLVSELDRTKYMPIVVLPVDGPLVRELKKNHVETHVISYPILRRKYFNPKGMLSFALEYRRSCRAIYQLFSQDDISIIHVNTLAVLEGIYLKSLFKAKLIWHVHEIITSPKIAYQVTAFLAGKFATKIVAVSEQVKKHLVDSKRVCPEQVRVIYNGIDTNRFRPHGVPNSLYQEFGLSSDNLVVGMIGRLNSWKGQQALLNAMIPLLKDNDNLRLVFVGGVFEGETHFRDELAAKIQASGVASQIVLKDFRTDMNDIYQLFDIFCLPSTSPDPLPTVVLEAMASGKPVVGFNHGGVTEMVVEGYNGYLVKPVEIQALTKRISDLIVDPELIKRMGLASRERAVKDFSPNQFIQNFEQVYDKSLRGDV